MAKLERIKTGVKGLDKLLQGGIPKNSVVLLTGAPGSGKTTFARQVLYNVLENDFKAIYITTAELPSSIIQQIELMDLDISKFGDKIRFIDCYSWRVSASLREKSDYQLDSLTKLNDLDMFLGKAIEDLKIKNDGIVVLDSISDLLLHAEHKSVFKLMQLLTGKIKAAGGIGIFLIEEGVHEQKELATLNYITDGTFEMKIEGESRKMRIKRMADTLHPLKWIDFEIGKGLELKVEEFFK